MAKKQSANVQNATIEQNAEAQKPNVQNVGAVVTLASVKPQANESGKTAPATTAQKETAKLTADELKFRDAFKGMATIDVAQDAKYAICAELFLPITSYEQLKSMTRHAIYGYIHGRAGKQEAEKWFGMKNQSMHELYKVASNAVKRAKNRAMRDLKWQEPQAPNAGAGAAKEKAEAKAPGQSSELLSTLNKLINSDPEFTAALSHVLASKENVTLFKAWATKSAAAAENHHIMKLAA